MTREEFIIIYQEFELEYLDALKKADLQYQSIVNSVVPYQKVVNDKGEEVRKITDSGEFVIEEKTLPNGNIQKPDYYFFKEKPLTLTIPSGVDGYPDFGPFNIDPIDHPEDIKISSERLSTIYGEIFSGYVTPILFKYLKADFLLHEVDRLSKEVVSLKEEVKELKEDVRILQASVAVLTGGASAVPNVIEGVGDVFKRLRK